MIPVADPGFSPGGVPTPKNAIIFQFFAENCMKMKEFGPPGGARVPGAPPWILQWIPQLSQLIKKCDRDCANGIEDSTQGFILAYLFANKV